MAALTTIEEFNHHFKTHFPDDEFDTIGGFIAHAFGHLPAVKEQITLKQLQFTVIKSNTRRLIELEVRRMPHQK